MREQPYFLSNEEWYTSEKKEDDSVVYSLTSNAPIEAIRSFNEYYSDPEFYDENGSRIDLSGYVVS